eukprot:EG_transcript_27936
MSAAEVEVVVATAAGVEEDLDGIDPDNEFHACVPRPKLLFSYDWAKGFIAPWVASPGAVVTELLRTLQLTESDTLADLGCGDGHVCLAAARTYGCRAIGFELDEDLVRGADQTARENRLDHLLAFQVQDLRALQPSDMQRLQVTVIVIYLLPETLHSLEGFLRRCMQTAGVRCVASITWPLRAFAGDEHAGFFVYPAARNLGTSGSCAVPP